MILNYLKTAWRTIRKQSMYALVSRRLSPDFKLFWADAGFIETLKPDELR